MLIAVFAIVMFNLAHLKSTGCLKSKLTFHSLINLSNRVENIKNDKKI